MSEKRFELYSDDYFVGAYDNVTQEKINVLKSIDLINSLVEENKQLKQQLKNKVIVNKQYEENCRLKADLKHERLVSKTLREVMKLQNKLLNEAEDLIESRLPDHYIKQYKNIKKGILDEGENI